MINHPESFYHAIIKQVMPNTSHIDTPQVTGIVAPVFIVDCQGKKTTFRFNHPSIIQHNKYISDLMRVHNIPMPHTQAYYLDGVWFETYQYIPYKTLYELIHDGISDNHIYHAYKSAIDIQKKLLEINIKNIHIPQCPRYIDIINKQLEIVPMLGTALLKRMLYNAATFGEQRLCHNDIHSKNILYSPETKQTYLIDLDAVATCNPNIGLINILRNYPLSDKNKLLDYYNSVTCTTVSRPAITAASKIINIPNVLKSKIHRSH